MNKVLITLTASSLLQNRLVRTMASAAMIRPDRHRRGATGVGGEGGGYRGEGELTEMAHIKNAHNAEDSGNGLFTARQNSNIYIESIVFIVFVGFGTEFAYLC